MGPWPLCASPVLLAITISTLSASLRTWMSGFPAGLLSSGTLSLGPRAMIFHSHTCTVPFRPREAAPLCEPLPQNTEQSSILGSVQPTRLNIFPKVLGSVVLDTKGPWRRLPSPLPPPEALTEAPLGGAERAWGRPLVFRGMFPWWVLC